MQRLTESRDFVVRAGIALAGGIIVFLGILTIALAAGFAFRLRLSVPGGLHVSLPLVIGMAAAGYVTAWIGRRQELLFGLGLWLALSLVSLFITQGSALESFRGSPSWILALLAAAAGAWVRRLVRQKQETGLARGR